MDPPRLRSDAGLEGRLLRSAPSLEPAPSAQDELWKRLQVATAVAVAAGAVGAATATSGAAIGGQAAATAAPELAGSAGGVAAKAMWLSVVKWGAIVAVGIPALGGTYAAIQHHRAATEKKIEVAAPPRPAPPVETSREPAPLPDPAPVAPVTTTPPPVLAPHPAHVAHRPEAADARSALRAESALLGDARAKLGAGSFRAALDDVARLGGQFPRGRLVQEREVVAIDALTGLGNHAAARARAQAFLERFPESPYAARVRQSLEP